MWAALARCASGAAAFQGQPPHRAAQPSSLRSGAAAVMAPASAISASNGASDCRRAMNASMGMGLGLSRIAGTGDIDLVVAARTAATAAATTELFFVS